MNLKKNTIVSVLMAVPQLLVYLVWLIASAVFGLVVFLLVTLFPNRSPHHAARYGAEVPSRIGVIASDVVAVLLAYIAADFLRCTQYMHTSWPEVEPNYGSTISVHLRMMAFLPIAWPLILRWLGWYRPRWRSWQWKATRTVSASVLLGLSMAAFSLLFDRLIYPRAQILFVVVVLPVATAAVRGIINLTARLLGLRPARPTQPVAPDVW